MAVGVDQPRHDGGAGGIDHPGPARRLLAAGGPDPAHDPFSVSTLTLRWRLAERPSACMSAVQDRRDRGGAQDRVGSGTGVGCGSRSAGDRFQRRAARGARTREEGLGAGGEKGGGSQGADLQDAPARDPRRVRPLTPRRPRTPPRPIGHAGPAELLDRSLAAGLAHRRSPRRIGDEVVDGGGQLDRHRLLVLAAHRSVPRNVHQSPVRRWTTTSGMPPTRVATTGAPQAMASRLVIPNGS